MDQWIDVVEEFRADIRMQLMPPVGASEEQRATPETASLFEESLTQEQKAVFDLLRADEAIFVDSILSSVQLPPPTVLMALLELEMRGLIRQLPGKNFIRKL